MLNSKTASAKMLDIEPSYFIGKPGYYLWIREGKEIGIGDFDAVTLEPGICTGVSNYGPYCSTPGGQASWYPTVDSALQLAYLYQEDWFDMGYKKPLHIILGDAMKQVLENERLAMNSFDKSCAYEREMHSRLHEGFYSEITQLGAQVEHVRDKARQLLGIDTIITKPNGEQVYVDEKAREKKDKNTFGLEIWNNYGGKGNFTSGWFMDETKLTHWYCFLHTENGVNYATFVNVKNLKDKLFSILTRKELLDCNGQANAAVKSKIEGAFVYDSNQWEHGRFLILPMDFYKKVPGTFEMTI